jgi:hypothetical protein
MKYLDDVKDGDSLGGTWGVRGTSIQLKFYKIADYMHDGEAEVVIHGSGMLSDCVNGHFKDRAVDEKLAHDMADFIRDMLPS